MRVMPSSSRRVSVIISWNPHISLTAEKAKQELWLIIYTEKHRNIQRLSDLPRDMTVMSIIWDENMDGILGPESLNFYDTWDHALGAWTMRCPRHLCQMLLPQLFCGREAMSWRRLSHVESNFITQTPLLLLRLWPQNNSFFWAKPLRRTREVPTCGHPPPVAAHCQLSHTEPFPWPGDCPESPVVWAMPNPMQNILHSLHMTDLLKLSFSFIDQAWMST